MKYILLVTAAAVAVFALSFGVIALVNKLLGKRIKKPLYVILSVALSLVIFSSSALVYFNVHYSAEDIAAETVSMTGATEITKTDYGYFFDGKGEDSALIFYQGAKVDCEAYAPLMKRIADGGVDCFLLSSPFRMPFFASNLPQEIIDSTGYKAYAVGGHSLGGTVAAAFAAENPGEVSGVVLLASYPSKELDPNLSLLSIYGSRDGVFDLDAYNAAKKNFPENFKEIELIGANHAGFGNYGEQKGDNNADISAEEQQNQTAASVIDFCKELGR